MSGLSSDPSITEAEFDACVQPLLRNLTYRAERLCGRDNAPDRVSAALLVAWRNIHLFTPPNECSPAPPPRVSPSGRYVSTVPTHFLPRVLPRAYGNGWNQLAFLAWLHRILDFECANFIRQQRRRTETLLPAHTIFEFCDGPSAPVWEDECWLEQRKELRRLLSSVHLTSRQWECTLGWLRGATLREIGRSLDPPISARAVCGHIQRAGRILAKHYDPDLTTSADIRECFENLPAALTYQAQRQRWNRIRNRRD